MAYVDSEVGRLRTVLLHRPGAELKRLTPRNNDQLLFDGIPWVGRAQEEHDTFADALRQRGVEVLYLAEMLEEALQVQAAREETIAAALADVRLGATLRGIVNRYMHDLHPTDLAGTLVAGLARSELKTGRGLVREWLEGGDVLLLSPGVLAVGTGQRTTPAGVETLARRIFAGGVAHTVLVVPVAQERATMHLDTVCTMVDTDAVVMYPAVAHTMTAYAVTPGNGEELAVAAPVPFLRAAAEAMGIDRLRMIDTGLDPVTAEREQWDDGNK